MPSPVSATSAITCPPSLRVVSVSQPPAGMASKAFTARFTKTCWSLFSSPRSGGSAGSSSLRMRMCELFNWWSRRESTSPSTRLRFTIWKSVCPWRAKLSSPLTIFEARSVCFSILVRSGRRGSFREVWSCSIWVKLEIPVSGVFTSCATPAARTPRELIFSRSCISFSIPTRSVMSSKMRMAPWRCPAPDMNGAALTFTTRSRPSAALRFIREMPPPSLRESHPSPRPASSAWRRLLGKTAA